LTSLLYTQILSLRYSWICTFSYLDIFHRSDKGREKLFIIFESLAISVIIFSLVKKLVIGQDGLLDLYNGTKRTFFVFG